MGTVLALAQASGAELARTDRDALLAEVRGNPGTTLRLRLEAVTYLQGENPGENPNANFMRFSSARLEAIAASFAGAPFLRDHQQRELLARGGTILESRVVEAAGGGRAFRQSIELVKPWAVEAALDGTLDRFSIGWAPVGQATCTVCSAPLEIFWGWLFMDCEHQPGETYTITVKGKEYSALCEIEFADAIGVECSGVSVPAVLGTEVEEIRAALARTASGHGPAQKKEPEMTFAMKLAALLGLAAAATEDEIEVKLGADLEAHKATKAALGTATGRVATLEAELAQGKAAQLDADVSALIAGAIGAGKLRPKHDAAGARVETALESAIRSTAKTLGLAAAKEYVDGLPSVLPVGRPSLTVITDPTGNPGPSAGLTATELSVAKQMGITPEAFAKKKAELAAEAQG